MTQSLWLQNFLTLYSGLNKDNLTGLAKVYHPEVIFSDPLHQVNGIDELTDYFTKLYQNLISCDFVIEEMMESGTQAAVYWTMTFCHKRLNGGSPISVSGHSHLKSQDNKVIYHRDYFDVGAMLYENIGLIGAMIRLIKHRAVN
ncbi:nuclear transport factor 2 family protein [Shewanella sp. AS1]|uniref:nuclear transport factor 2 family protein n=1 Tax=Shewanella sp. AS1 TaxID=2907626 RepID=UPI001F25EA06|nr:nuclear transport factor 2 family protein [Shewanella sp. AS1]MCE9679481.1 nuclear transport factor 2 family protein [Shewanella sp. AS1]